MSDAVPATSPTETPSQTLDIARIRALLPHRYPFLLVDRVTALEKGKQIVAIKNVTINEPFFNGHFPSQPVMPGVLIIEALAQAAALLAFESDPPSDPTKQRIVYLAGIDDARFKKPVVPGDQLVLTVEIDRIVRNIGKFKCRATVDGKLATEATLIAALQVA
jgi:3-hydroxyacyl-[acyl-carrier-protein] dehydratase